MAYVPINREALADKHWRRHASIAFAKNDTVTPLYVNELAIALQALPIAFVQQEDRFSLVVIVGLRPGENLLVSAANTWLSEYLPVSYRSSPFELIPLSGNESQYAMCIDEECITDTDEGEPFFNEAGEINEDLGKLFELLKQFNAGRQQTQNICAALAKHNLIVPWPMVLEQDTETLNVNGLYQIDESALNALSDEAFLDLKRSHALPVAYAQLLSMHKISGFGELMRQRAATTKIDKQPATDTFNFAGLS